MKGCWQIPGTPNFRRQLGIILHCIEEDHRMLRCAIQYLCLSVSISASFQKTCFPANTCSISAQWLMAWLKLTFICFRVGFFFFFFNGIQLTTLTVLLPTSCTQEAVFHLMATNTIYQQNTLKDCVRAMLLNTILWMGSRHYKSVSPSGLLRKEKRECPPAWFCTWMYAELDVRVTTWSWQPPWLQQDLNKKTWSGKVASDETIQTMLYIKSMNIVQKVENNNTNSKCKSK